MDDQTRIEIDGLKEQIASVEDKLTALSKFAPPIAAKRMWNFRIGYEVTGLGIAAVGAWWIFPASALLLVGIWLLADVIVSRRHATKEQKR